MSNLRTRPSLLDHVANNFDDHVGTLLSADVSQSIWKSVVRFATDDRSQSAKAKILSGIRKSVSMGFRMKIKDREEIEDDAYRYKVGSMTLMEISSVSSPAVAGVGFSEAFRNDLNAQFAADEKSGILVTHEIAAQDDSETGDEQVAEATVTLDDLKARRAELDAQIAASEPQPAPPEIDYAKLGAEVAAQLSANQPEPTPEPEPQQDPVPAFSEETEIMQFAEVIGEVDEGRRAVVAGETLDGFRTRMRERWSVKYHDKPHTRSKEIVEAERGDFNFNAETYLQYALDNTKHKQFEEKAAFEIEFMDGALAAIDREYPASPDVIARVPAVSIFGAGIDMKFTDSNDAKSWIPEVSDPSQYLPGLVNPQNVVPLCDVRPNLVGGKQDVNVHPGVTTAYQRSDENSNNAEDTDPTAENLTPAEVELNPKQLTAHVSISAKTALQTRGGLAAATVNQCRLQMGADMHVGTILGATGGTTNPIGAFNASNQATAVTGITATNRHAKFMEMYDKVYAAGGPMVGNNAFVFGVTDAPALRTTAIANVGLLGIENGVRRVAGVDGNSTWFTHDLGTDTDNFCAFWGGTVVGIWAFVDIVFLRTKVTDTAIGALTYYDVGHPYPGVYVKGTA